jgi:amino acid adenylation domain-containing protein
VSSSDETTRRPELSPAKRALIEKRLRGKSGGLAKAGAIPRRPGRGFARLSFAQQRLWFIDQLEPDNLAYNLTSVLRLKGRFNLAAFKLSAEEIVRRHESLRTNFAIRDGEPVQVIHSEIDLPLSVVDLREMPEEVREAEAVRLLTEQARVRFDLSAGPLLRVMLLRMGESHHLLLLAMHHIISDGWSMGVLVEELSQLYASCCAGKDARLPELAIQYADFAEWQRGWFRDGVLQAQLAYWKRQLAGAPAVMELPSDRVRPPYQSFRGAVKALLIPKPLSDGVAALSLGSDVTEFMTLLAVLQSFLYRHTRQADVVVGSPIANRHGRELEGLIGFFVNTLLLRTDLSGDPTLRELLATVKEVTLSAYAHQDLPFERLVEELQPERDLNRNPLFQAAFVLQNTPARRLELPGLTVSAEGLNQPATRVDLEFHLLKSSEGFKGYLIYSTDLFDETTIDRMAARFEILLRAAVTNPDARLSELPLLTEAESSLLLHELNDTDGPYPFDECVHQRLAAQAAVAPDALAVVFDDQQLTYGELNGRANQLARHLLECRLEPESLVALCFEGSIDNAALFECGEADCRRPLIGRPIANAKAYLLDELLNVVALGVAGEIYIGGAVIARGYLAEPAPTADRFIPDPFSRRPGARLYRSGELGRRRADGNIEFLGRIDNQLSLRGHRVEPGEIESALTQHPAISEAAVVARENSAGETQLVAYVVPNASGGPTQSLIAQIQTSRVSHWRMLYDATYGRTPPEADLANTFAGWNSSYTGLPIPEDEMREWRDATVERILALSPSRVLEIGCGSGLLLLKVASHCTRYLGTDFSKVSLDALQRELITRGDEFSHVRLVERMADDFEGIEAGALDTVIINSVVQYFPDLDYLLRVLQGAVKSLSAGGLIFLGDLRNVRLLEALHVSVQLHQSPPSVSAAEVWRRAQRRATQEEELLIDPAFFMSLQDHLPEISRAEVKLKRGRHHNEMNCFRYDVVLRTGREAMASAETHRLRWQPDLSLDAVRDLLRRQQPDALLIQGVPNARTLAYSRAVEAMADGDTIEGLKREALSTGERGIDPEAFWSLEAELPYAVDALWPDDEQGACYGVLCCRASEGKDGSPGAGRYPPFEPVEPKPLASHSNNPLRALITRELAPQMRDFLKARLPDYMIPSNIMVLDALPMTPGGKLDKCALPPPEPAQREADAEEISPRTPVEELLAGVWADVLYLKRVGLHDNFFELGGHSLLATQVVFRLRESFSVELPLRALFEAPTVAQLAMRIDAAMKRCGELRRAPLLRTTRRVHYQLSFAQQRLWFLSQLDPKSPVYNMPSAIQIQGRLNREALENALNEIIRRHETLRTAFGEIDGQPVQAISAGRALTLAAVDLCQLEELERESELQRLINDEARQKFDLVGGPLIRARLARLNRHDHVLMLSVHHIVSDGWSMGVMIREIGALYKAFAAGESSLLNELPIQYADFVQWQRGWLTGEVLETELRYWEQQLSGAPALLELPTDRPRPRKQTFRGAVIRFEMASGLPGKLHEVSRQRDATLFMTLLAVFQVLLHRYTGQADISVGSPIANRNSSETEGLIGFFVNTLVLRADLSGDPTFNQLLARLREVALGAYANQDVPFEMLVERLRPERDTSHSPLFQAMFALQNAPAEALVLKGLTLKGCEAHSGTTKFDLTFSVFETPDSLAGTVEYNTDLFDERSIKQLLGHYEILLDSVAANPQCRISRLQLLTAAEVSRLLHEWVPAPSPSDRGTRLHELFEQQVEHAPERIAITFDGQQITYAELNRRANRLAHYLLELGVGLDTPVAICQQRSIEGLVSLIAIFKAGGTYVPLDPGYPKERLALMLEDAAPRVLLTEPELLAMLPETRARVVYPSAQWADRAQCADRTGWGEIGSHSEQNPVRAVAADNLRYVIYTSGSTGRPKGIAMTERALCNLLAWQLESSPLAGRTVTLQYASLSFDVSFQEIFSAWCSGGRLALVREETRRDGRALLRLLHDESLGRLFIPFVALQQLAEASEGSAAPPGSLVEITAGGEQLKLTPQIKLWFERLKGCALHNHYGPSEAHVVTAMSLSGSPGDWPGIVPIGRPISNTRVYILDKHLQPVPVGVAGEVFIGGEGLARGYVSRAELTAERFIADPFGASPGARLYKSGDMARHLSDGVIVFLGRADSQVKVRGFRIEMEEIELALRQHQNIGEAVVVAQEDARGRKRLIAYLVTEPEGRVSSSELRGHLREHLPEYMIPSIFVHLEKLPVTPTGKVDRRALVAADQPCYESEEGYFAPRNPIEAALAELWAEVLGVDRVGISDNFFDFGGHSLLATQLMARISRVFTAELALRNLFENPTIADLAPRLEEALKLGPAAKAPPLCRVSGRHFPLSFPQQRLWFLDQLEPASPAYNIATAIKLDGKLNVTAIESTLGELLRRHGVLRTRFAMIDGHAAQIVEEPQRAHINPLPLIDLRDFERSERERETRKIANEEASREFDLQRAPLFRAGLVMPGPEDHVLLMSVHHIVGDGWSIGVIAKEIAALYAFYSQGRPSPLEELAVQYADFAHWQRSWFTGDVLAAQTRYWREQLRGAAVLDLPTNRARPAVRSLRGARKHIEISEDLATPLKQLSRIQGTTLFMTLLGGLKLLLYRYSGQEDLSVGIPVAGRQQAATEDLVGFFVNTLVLRSDLSGEPTFQELLERVRETALKAYAHQDLPFEQLVEELQTPRDLSHTPLFQVMFVFQNAPDCDLKLPGLSASILQLQNDTAKFDLTLSLSEAGGCLKGALEYSTDLFDGATVERMARHFLSLLEEAVAVPSARIGNLSLLSAPEREQILNGWNQTASPYASSLCLHQLFELQAGRSGDAIASVFAGEHVSFGELNRRANQLARHLQQRGVGPEAPVGLCLWRSTGMILAMLATLKAGGAYVPLDPEYPETRLSDMLADASVVVLVSERQLIDRLPRHGGETVLVDEDWPHIAGHDTGDVGGGATGQNLAYVMYTSGSTGRPKGVAIEHRGAVNLMQWAGNHFSVEDFNGVLASTSICFDLSVFEIFAPLACGGKIVMAENALELARMQEAEGVSLINTVPSALGELLRMGAIPRSVRTVNVAGEVLSGNPVEQLYEHGHIKAVWNLYGPTEDTVYTTCALMKSTASKIGRPLSNTRVHALDPRMQPVPPGVAGELHIAGDGLARCYFHRAELTAEQFVPDPYGPRAGGRLYRTGDLARYLPDGQIEYLGRTDRQVKLRGYRIEPGEVEATVNQHPNVREAAVTLHDDEGEKRLVAYVSFKEASHEPVNDLRFFIKQRLPDYMIPAAFVRLESLPRTSTGKLNRNALPKPDNLLEELAAGCVAPNTPTEVRLVRIWEEVLKVKGIGIKDNFFELGGHSLLATRILYIVRDTFGVSPSMRSLFRFPTVEGLARMIDEQLAQATGRSVV